MPTTNHTCHRARLLLAGLLLLASAFVGCNEWFEDRQQGVEQVQFTLRNRSKVPVHLWTPTGSASGPGAVLQPGESRSTTVSVKVESFNDQSAQRDKQIVDIVRVASQRPNGEVVQASVQLHVSALHSWTLSWTEKGWYIGEPPWDVLQ